MNPNSTDYPPTFASVAKSINSKLHYQVDSASFFIIFLRDPNYYDYAFEPSKTSKLSTAIDFYLSKVKKTPTSIKLFNPKTNEEIDLESTFEHFQSEDVIFISVDGKIAENKPEPEPPATQQDESDDNQHKTQQNQENNNAEQNNNNPPNDLVSDDDDYHSSVEQSDGADVNPWLISDVNPWPVSDEESSPTVFQLRRNMTPEERAFISNLVEQYRAEESTALQIYILNDRDREATEATIRSLSEH